MSKVATAEWVPVVGNFRSEQEIQDCLVNLQKCLPPTIPFTFATRNTNLPLSIAEASYQTKINVLHWIPSYHFKTCYIYSLLWRFADHWVLIYFQLDCCSPRLQDPTLVPNFLECNGGKCRLMSSSGFCTSCNGEDFQNVSELMCNYPRFQSLALGKIANSYREAIEQIHIIPVVEYNPMWKPFEAHYQLNRVLFPAKTPVRDLTHLEYEYWEQQLMTRAKMQQEIATLQHKFRASGDKLAAELNIDFTLYSHAENSLQQHMLLKIQSLRQQVTLAKEQQLTQEQQARQKILDEEKEQQIKQANAIRAAEKAKVAQEITTLEEKLQQLRLQQQQQQEVKQQQPPF
jgi:hypothetical protein